MGATPLSAPYSSLKKGRPDAIYPAPYSDSTIATSPTSSSFYPRRTSKHQKRFHTTAGKVILLVSVSFLLMAIIHLNHSTDEYPSSSSASISVPSTTLSSSSKDQTSSPLTPVPTSETIPSTKTSIILNNNNEDGDGDKSLEDVGVILSNNELTTTIHFENGTQSKIFKPAFFKNPEAAKMEMGSFLETLAAWPRLSPETTVEGDIGGNINGDNNSDNTSSGNNIMNENEDEEEEESIDDKRVVSNMSSGRYFGYLPMGGGNNQFVSLQKAAVLAKDLKRTLVLPPISPNTHIPVWAGPRYSQFYDLERFTQKSGISIIEWHDIKQAPEQVSKDFTRHWQDFSEDLPCIPNAGIGISDTSLYDKFRPQFLLKYKMTIAPGDTTEGKSRDYNYARDVLVKDSQIPAATDSGVDNDDAQNVDPNMWKCLTCPYFLSGGDLGARTWSEVGVHLRFNDETEAMVDDILDILLGPVTEPVSVSAKEDEKEEKEKEEKEEEEREMQAEEDNVSVLSSSLSRRPFRPHPEFIIIHLRRGDIVNKCPAGMSEKDCIVQIEAIAEKVEEIEKGRRQSAMDKSRSQSSKDVVEEKEFVYERLPVLVTTNEKRAEELEKLDRLGWILLDHGDEVAEDEMKTTAEEKDGKDVMRPPRKVKKLGTMSRLGPWYPPMLDAVLLTRGTYLIGMGNSRMSILATQRGAAWHGHHTMLM
ncbi:hypothetical protein EDD11_007390 [Mortierella claussenii]|nr:hypothetical protein EDD11_007390 [Mortierella claussenii]